MLKIGLVFLLGLLPQPAPAQSGLSFDVASVKPAVMPNITQLVQAAQAGKLPRIGMTVEGTRVDIALMSLADLIPIAYGVKPFQVAGPDWLNSERFDIQARMPEGSTSEQIPQMLQALLAERFQLKIHRENREHSVYALVVARGGVKMKESDPDPVPADGEAPKPAAGNSPIGMGLGNGTQVRIDNAGGAARVDGATITTPQNGTIKMSRSPDGQSIRMEYSKLTMAQLADGVGRFLDKPVVDMTDLKGNYRAALDLSVADYLKMMSITVGISLPPEITAARANPAQTGQASDPSSNSVFTSVKQLGLQLDSRKTPVEFVVIDHVEKAPTEN
jgi:uncharacterized protein (TIGR03435 family)